ncbi:MAG TPA: hypothetical protein VMW25_03465 [Clostridia bacterium]|nr:hypothetical protein [Clostridia bacterium]
MFNDNYWNMFQNKSYQRKKHIIEKTKYAIDSPGEIKQISAEGWIANNRKRWIRGLTMKKIKAKKLRGAIF